VVQRVGVVGFPIGHSISPAIHQAAFDALGIPARYERWEVAPADLPAWVAALRAPQTLGANVTVPHKEAVVPLLDALSPTARAIGAVNTIVHRDGQLYGDNTDAAGFLRALDEVGGVPRGAPAVLLGAGGAARAVAYALLQAGIGALAIFNRHAERARALAVALQAHAQVPVEGFPLDAPQRAERLARCALLVNTTSVGLHGDERLLPPAEVPAHALVVDIIYNPPQTPLLADAERRGARTLNGLPMLVYQAALAFECWTGHQPPLERMFAAARAALA
jgi:shikimate dehydrogenase